MGHRALVARERADGRHDVHYSQWGGADCSLARALARDPWPAAGVTPEPRATGVPWTDLLAEHLDPLVYEALFVRDEGGDVRAYRTLWLGDAGGGAAGLLAEVRWAAPCDDVRVGAWFEGARAVARRASRQAAALAPPEAATLVEECLREWAGDREVVRIP